MRKFSTGQKDMASWEWLIPAPNQVILVPLENGGLVHIIDRQFVGKGEIPAHGLANPQAVEESGKIIHDAIGYDATLFEV